MTSPLPAPAHKRLGASSPSLRLRLPRAKVVRRGMGLTLVALAVLAQALLLSELVERTGGRESGDAVYWIAGVLVLLAGVAGGMLLSDGEAVDSDSRQVGNFDPLTHTLNRRGFMSAAAQEYTRSIRYNRPLSVLALRVSIAAHERGELTYVGRDTVLERLAAAWQAEVRTTDTVGRVGRHEFAILLPETGAPTAAELAARMRHASAALPLEFLSPGAHVRVEVGVGSIVMGDSGIEHALARAESAME